MEKIIKLEKELRNEMIHYISKNSDAIVTNRKDVPLDTLFNICKVIDREINKPVELHIYTDGGYSIEKNVGAGAFVIPENGKSKIQMGGVKIVNASNNIAELMAIKCALEYIDNGTYACVHSDSQYAIGVLTGQMNAKKNKELIQDILDLIKQKKLKIKFEWVKGHSGNKYNEMCDTLCDKIAGIDLNSEYEKFKKKKK